MFSFIIPCYNNRQFLRAALTSISWQNEPYEVILIDANSDKEPPDQVYEAFKDIMDMTLIKQPHLKEHYSLCLARNKGLQAAKGNWIITLDADIILQSDYLAKLSHLIADLKKSVIIASERIFINGDSVDEIDPNWAEQQKHVKSVANYYQEKDRRLPMMEQLDESPHPWAFMHGSNVVFPKKEALVIGGYDEAYDGHWGYEDVDFAYRMITQQNVKPFYSADLFCYHLEPKHSRKEEQSRFDKKHNPNWKRICERIPGFKEYKEQVYRELSPHIEV